MNSPLDAGQKLISQYQEKLQFFLENRNLPDKDINHILGKIQINSGIYLSLNPRYAQTDQAFANFIQDKNLSDKLVTTMPKLVENGLYAHQRQGILSILDGHHTIISTGTGSGKTETFLIPILDHCLQTTERGTKAIIIYPMNALAGDQVERIGKYTRDINITFGLYTGATPENNSDGKIDRKFPNQLICRDEIRANPPDILITNYVMLDRMLTRDKDQRIFIESMGTLRHIVLDELHTYTGSKATHLKYLLTRLRYYCKKKPIYIGTSATLISDKAGKARLDTFLKNLFDIDNGNYTFVEALKDPFYDVPVQLPLLFNRDDINLMDFSKDDTATKSISILTGQDVNTLNLYSSIDTFHETSISRSLLANYYVNVIRTALTDGAQSYDDLLKHISAAMPSKQIQIVSPERLLFIHLEAINYLNEKAGERGKPILDYRLHVFLRNLTGTLKICPSCSRYFSGDVRHCPDDRFILFAVYRHDIRFGVGKFNGQVLSSELVPESTDHELVHYVTIKRVDEEQVENPALSGNITSDGQFKVQAGGMYQLEHLKAQNYEQLESDLIHIGNEKSDYLYLVHLVKTLLQTYGKSLGFVDNRELASRYSTIIRDEFASEFLYEFLRLNYPRQFELNDTLTYLQKKWERKSDLSELEKSVFEELPIWFYRMISIPERLGGRVDLLKWCDDIQNQNTLTDLQRDLLDIFIRERAIDAVIDDGMANSHFIRFQKYWATSHYGIFIEDTHSTNPLYRGISLNNQSRIYQDFIEKWTLEAIQSAIEILVNHDILTRNQTPDGKVFYQLKCKHLRFNLASSPYGEGDDGYVNMAKKLLFRAEVHSSDLQTHERENIEAGLKRGDVHFVAATPTLEMGIDIGDLESVLMIGAPPTPASYAQRAGRAGRGTNHNALIITFCSTSAHDTYAFHNPRHIINGRVAPPIFNPGNTEILKQHIHAFVLAHHLKNRETLRQFESNLIKEYRNQIPRIRQLFGNWFDYTAYEHEFSLLPAQILRNTDGKNISLIHHCYTEGIFPDYSFRRDQVIAVDIDDQDKLHNENTLNWQEYALTSRTPEQSIRFFTPDQTIYVAGDIYKTLNDGIYDILDDGARQYTCFYAEKEMLFAQQRKVINRYDLRQHFGPAITDLTDVGGVLAIGYTDNCQLSFRNHGIRQPKRGSSTSNAQIRIGYDLKREAFNLRFDSLICDDVLRNSLAAVLVRAINLRYGLADGEIILMLNARLPDDPEESPWQYILFYDGDGNSNLPFRDILQDFESIVSSAYDALVACDCETNGCYDCIRSYNTQFFDATLSKSQALMFTGYLLGKNLFEPAVTPFTSANASFDLILNIKQQNNKIIVTSNTGGQ